MSDFANVYVGAAPNDLTGDPLRNAFQKINTNFANIASGNATIVVNAPVLSVAGRTGNITLTVNDVLGAASNAWVNAQTTAANTYANVLYATTTSNITNNVYSQVSANLSSNIAQTASDLVTSGNLLGPIYANINTINANVAAANTAIGSLNTSVTGLTISVGLLTASNTAQDANLGTATTNISTINANVAAANTRIATNTQRVAAANVRIDALSANLGIVTANIADLYANAGSQSANLAVLTANINNQYNTLIVLTSNAATQTVQINSLRSNITAANSAITALQSNAAVQHAELIALISNSAIQGVQINTISANLGTATININSLLSDVSDLQANLAPVQALQANDAVQSNQIAAINANVTAANAVIGGQATAISSLIANINAANTAIITANTGMKSYVDTVTTSWTANAVAQAAQISVIDANLGTATNNITTLLGNAYTQQIQINSINANVTAANASITSLNAGATLANLEIDKLRSNINAANLVTASFISTTNANITAANTEINSLRANITAANTKITPVSNLNAIIGNLIPITSNTYTIGTTSKYWSELHVGGNIETPSYLQVGKSIQTQLTETGNLNSNTALIYAEAIVGNIRTVDAFGVANLGNIITTAGVFWSNGAEYRFSNVNVAEYMLHFDNNLVPGLDSVYDIGRGNLQVRDIFLSNSIVLGGEVITVSGQQISINGLPLSANTGNIAFSGTTITTDAGAGTGIILNSAGAGEIAMLDYVGINNTNPGYWLHVGDGSLGNVGLGEDNVGQIAVDFRSNNMVNRGSTIVSYAYWNAASEGNNNRGTGPHQHFGIYKNDGTYNTRYIEFDLTSGNANVGNLRVLGNVAFTMANYQNWTSNVSSIGAALDQLAARLKAAGF
jgi:hypothetical protein